jgi:NADH-quinone oxidoreductase subunit J
VQVIVYAGAIMVLFLFVLMLLKPEHEKNFFEENPKLKWLAIFIGLFVFLQIVYVIIIGKPSASITSNVQKSVETGTVENIGRELYTKYVIPIQAAAFLLLSATIGAMVLAKKRLE